MLKQVPLLYRALKLSRASRFLPYIGAALVAVGNLRMLQAAAGLGNERSTGPDVTLILKSARKTLQHALRRKGLEASTRTEGRLALAQVNWLLGDLDEGLKLATQGLEEAHRSSLMRLVAHGERILGGILAAQDQRIKAIEYFDQALKIFRKCGMRLEEARTLQAYGEMLVQEGESVGKNYQRGVEYLQESLQMFVKHKAELDVKLVERVLGRCGATVQA